MGDSVHCPVVHRKSVDTRADSVYTTPYDPV